MAAMFYHVHGETHDPESNYFISSLCAKGSDWRKEFKLLVQTCTMNIEA